MSNTKAEQKQARTELLAVLDLLLGDGNGPATGDMLETLYSMAIASREYLRAENDSESMPNPHDLDSWLATTVSKLVREIAETYEMAQVEVMQAISCHLLANAMLVGAMTGPDDSGPETVIAEAMQGTCNLCHKQALIGMWALCAECRPIACKTCHGVDCEACDWTGREGGKQPESGPASKH